MAHKCTGEWYTWTQEDIESAKTADPQSFKGVTAVKDKHCDKCGKLLSIKKEY
jgi:hypothetical protein